MQTFAKNLRRSGGAMVDMIPLIRLLSKAVLFDLGCVTPEALTAAE